MYIIYKVNVNTYLFLQVCAYTLHALETKNDINAVYHNKGILRCNLAGSKLMEMVNNNVLNASP